MNECDIKLRKLAVNKKVPVAVLITINDKGKVIFDYYGKTRKHSTIAHRLADIANQSIKQSIQNELKKIEEIASKQAAAMVSQAKKETEVKETIDAEPKQDN